MTDEMGRLPRAFKMRPSGELVAIVGGGGKSSLMFALAEQLPGRVVMTTTTRIFASQMQLAPAVCAFSSTGIDNIENSGVSKTLSSEINGPAGANLPPLAELEALLGQHGQCLVVGAVHGEKASGVPPELPGRLFARPDVDFVLVEADGSRMKPCKAPAAHEPVIPPEATLVIPVAGVDAIGGRLAEVAHRPELVAAVASLKPDDLMTVEALARLITHPAGGLKSVPPNARVISLINKVETADQLVIARRVARSVLLEERIQRVVIGAVGTNHPVGEIHRRVTAVVLAAGESERMGRTKQLLPWGQTTVLGQTLANLQESAVYETLVVTGDQAEAVSAIAAEAKLPTIHNPDYASGEMLSSLQTALRTLPANRSAVLVVLADQPMVTAETIDHVLEAYWKGEHEIIAPSYEGKRGNPVLIGRPYFDELLKLPTGSAPRELLRRYAEAIQLVNVATNSVLLDLDSPAQYERWRPKA